MTVSWSVKIDWNNDDFATSHDEAAYCIDMDLQRGIDSKALVTTSGNGFETIGPGQGTITLDNHTGRFDPNNTGGALYGKIFPGRKFKITVTYGGTTYKVMAGIIYAIPPITDPAQKHVQLSVRGMMQKLDHNTSPVIIYRSSVTQVIASLLTQAAFPPEYIGTLDNDPQQLSNISADVFTMQTAIDIASSALGQFWESADGKVNFYSRGHSTMPIVAIDEDVVGKNIVRNMPWENIRNAITVTAHIKLKNVEQIIWQNANPIKVVYGTPVVVNAKFNYSIDVKILSCTVNSKADGSGYDWTGDVTAVITSSRGTGVYILLTNIWPTTTLYVTALTILGKPITDLDLSQYRQDDDSIDAYGIRGFGLNNNWLQDCNHAIYFAGAILAFLKAPWQTIEIVIDTRPDLQYLFDILDTINFTSSVLGSFYGYHVGYIHHKWNTSVATNGQSVLTTVVLMPRLTDGTTIANDPELPDVPYVPPIQHPPMPITSCTTGGNYSYGPPGNHPPDPGTSCPNDAPADGPYDLGISGEITTGGAEIAQGWFQCFLRSSAHANLSTVHVSGTLEVWDGSAFVPSTLNAGWTCEGLKGGSVVAVATLDSAVGEATFNIGGNVEIDGIRISVTSSGGYTRGDEVQWIYGTARYSPVNCPWNAPYKTPQLPVVADQIYCIEGVGGPWHGWDEHDQPGDGTDNYEWGAFSYVNPETDPTLNRGRLGWSGYHNAFYLSMPVGIDPGVAVMLHQEIIDAYHVRMYFKAKVTGNQDIPICISVSTNYGANSGSLDFYAYGANEGTIHRFTIDSAYISNVCFASP